MATTVEGTALTEAHRVAQVAIQAESVKDILAVWPLLDPSNLDRSFPDYARAARVVLDLRREQSATLAAGYYRAFREIEAGTSTPADIRLLAALAEEQALTSLLVTGPVEIKRAVARGKTTEQATERGLVTTAGAIMRLTANAGRDTLADAIERDPVARGYARVTDGSPCAFCAMLASRANYKEKSFASSDKGFSGKGTAKVHDHCGCTSEPIFGEDYRLPGRGDEFASLWEQSGKHYTGPDAVNAFRRAYERPHIERSI